VTGFVEQLAGGRDSAAVRNLAQAFGISPEQAQTTLRTVMPEMAQELERLTLSRGGLADLIEIYGRAQHETVIDDAALTRRNGVRDEGNELLGQIFGTKHKSRVVAQRAARESKLAVNLVKQMLPVIATMFMGGLERETRSKLGDIAAKRPETTQLKAYGADPFAGQQPLPIPGETRRMPNAPPSGGRGSGNPYRDLSDIIRRQGGRTSDGGSLAGIIRSIIGSVLGFQSKGIMGWIIRLIVVRWGWSILQFIVRRVLLGR